MQQDAATAHLNFDFFLRALPSNTRQGSHSLGTRFAKAYAFATPKANKSFGQAFSKACGVWGETP